MRTPFMNTTYNLLDQSILAIPREVQEGSQL